jgi:hypothetical protein
MVASTRKRGTCSCWTPCPFFGNAHAASSAADLEEQLLAQNGFLRSVIQGRRHLGGSRCKLTVKCPSVGIPKKQRTSIP